MGGKSIKIRQACALITSVETSIKPDLGFTRVRHMALEKGIKTRRKGRQRYLAYQHLDDHFRRSNLGMYRIYKICWLFLKVPHSNIILGCKSDA